MYDDFKPIQPIQEINQETKKKEDEAEEDQQLLLSILRSEKDALLKRVNHLEGDLSKLKSSVEALVQEKKTLLKEVEALKAQNEQLNKELSDAIAEKEKVYGFLNQLEGTFLNTIRDLKLNAVLEMLDLIKKVLKEIIDSAYFPHQETIIKAVSKVFETSMDIKGNITLKVSPADLELFNRLVFNISDALRKEINIEITEDKSLSAGEFVIETPKFWIERRRDEVIEDALYKVIGDVQDIQ